MFGPLGRTSVGAARRSRRRWIAIVAAALVVVLIGGELINQVVRAASPAARVGQRTWVAAVTPIAEDSLLLGGVLHAVRQGAASAQRITFDTELTNLVGESSDQLASYDGLGLVAPTAQMGALFRTVLVDRRSGAILLNRGFTLATGPQRGAELSAAAAATGSAFGAFLAADSAYRRFLAALPRHDDAGALPQATWITTPSSWSSSSATTYVNTLAATPALIAHEALSILAVSLQPPPVRVSGLTTPTTTSTATSSTSSSTTTSVPTGPPSSSTTSTSPPTSTAVTTTTLQIPPPGSVSELAATSEVRVIVVVANAGNAPLAAVAVTARLVPTGGDPAPQRTSLARVVALSTGTARYVELAAMRVHVGTRYSLVVSASCSGSATASKRIALSVLP